MSKLSMVAVAVVALLVLFVTSAYAQETVTLTVNSAYGSPDPSVGVHEYAKGTEGIVASVATPVAGGTGIQYACVGWKAKGSVPSHPGEIAAMGFTNSVTFTINSNVVLTWRWKAQYLLTLNVSPHLWAGHINFYCDSHPEEPSGTYPPTQGGYWTYLRVAQLTAVADRDYVFDHWSGGSQVLRLEPWKNPTVQKMRRPETITAVFLPTAQYTLTIVSAYGDPVGAGVYDPGTPVHWSATSPYPVDAVGTRYVALDPTSDDVVMYADVTMTVNWKTQYQLKGVVYPPDTGSISLIPEPEVGGWYDANTVVSCLATPIENWGFLNWSDDLSGTNNPENLTMSEAREITANFFQPTLTVASAYDSPDPAVGEHTYNYGATVTGSITSPLPIASSATALTYGSIGGPYGYNGNMGFRFTANKNITITKVSTYHGTGTVPITIWDDVGTLLKQVDVPDCVENVWTEADVSPPLALTAGQTYRIAAHYGYGYYESYLSTVASDISFLGWCYGSGSTPVFPNSYGSSTYAMNTANFKYEICESQYRCTGYTGTGSCPSGTELSVPPFVINTDSTLTWNWVIQHKLAVGVSPAGSGTVDISASPLGDGFYDLGTVVTLTANPIGVNALDYWSGGGMSGNASPTTITIDGPKAITANFARPRLIIANPKAAGTPSPAVGTYSYDRGAYPIASIAGTPVWIPQIAGPPVTILSQGFEGSWPPSGWTVGAWTQSTASKHSGTYSARGYNSSPSTTQSIYTTVTIPTGGSGTVTFWWSAAGGSSSALRFLIDGGQYASVTSTGWVQPGTWSLGAGTHTIQWNLWRRSGTSSSYHITGYIDDITVIGSSMIPDPNNKFAFQGYAGTGSCPSGTDASVTFTINTNSTLTWLWTGYHKLFTLVGADGGGSVSVSVPPDAEGYYDDVTPVVLTAVANEGWVFLSWSGGQTGSTNPVTVYMTATKTITANFGHSLVVASAYGAPSPVVGTSLYAHNASVTVNCGLNPYPGSGGTRYVCTGHLGTGNLSDGSETSMTFPITVNSTVTWNWDVQTNWYQVVAAFLPAGKGSLTLTPPTGPGNWVEGGTTISCSAVPIANWGFLNWSGDLSGSENPKDLYVDNNKSITANFFQPTLQVINPQAVGSPGPPVGTATYNYNASVTCSVSPFAYEVMSGTYNEGFESGLSAFWAKGGNANWFLSTRGPHSGAYAAESGDIADNQSTYLERVVIIGGGGGAVSWWWTVSSESGYDFLQYWVDGVLQTYTPGGTDYVRIAGSVGWTQVSSRPITEGIHTVRWRFMKDSSATSGWDGGLVDDIQVTNTTFASVNYKCLGYIGTGSCPSGTTNSVTFNITLNSSITWSWAMLCKMTTSVYPAGAGSVGLDPTALGDLYDPGTTVTLTATAGSGYKFGYWSDGNGPNVNAAHSYVFINQAKTWYDAKADCQARGGHLVTISSAAENALVTNLVPSNMAVWIGFTDEVSEGTFVWVTGESVVYTNWAGGEPNNDQGVLGEDYAELYTYSGIEGLWNDDYGFWTRPYVCEFEEKTPAALSYLNPMSIVMDSAKNVVANFTGDNVVSGFAGFVNSMNAITWSWTSTDNDWESNAAGVLRTVAATIGYPLPDSATCPRDGSRTLLGMNVSGALTYTIAYTKLSDTTWTCTADTNLAGLKDFYIDETGVMKEEMSTGDGPQAGSGSAVSPNDVWFEIHKVSPGGSSPTVYPNITTYQETSLAENTQYTRHVHAYNATVYGPASNDASKYTFIHDATPSDFFLVGSNTTVTKTSGGAGDRVNKYPIDISYNYARCQILLYASEVTNAGQPGRITKIRFQRSVGDNDMVNNAEIRLAHTSANMLPLVWTDASADTVVYSGNLAIPAAGTWYEITLNPAFSYNGGNNLLVSFRHQDGSAEATSTTWVTTYASWNWNPITSTMAGRCVALYDNAENPPTVPGPAAQQNTNFPKVQVDIVLGNVMVVVIPPANSTSGQTGVRLERGTDGANFPSLIQDFASTYSKTDAVPGSGTYYYRIRFQNGDAVPSVYSAGQSVVVP